MRKFLLTILVVIILGLSGYMTYWLFIDDVETMEPKIIEEEIYFEEIGKTIYVRAISWGISGNHNEVVFSGEPFSSKFREYNSGDLIFHTSSLFYKKKDSIHLVIYVQGSAVGNKLSSELNGVKILLKEMNTFDEIKKIDKNYKNMGINKISNDADL